jgi:CheY-like chemotaxis protein
MTALAPASILLVDDQHSRLLSYEAILAGLGETLVTARSGDEALRLLMQREFAIILLDVHMPGMDGFETAALIHQHPRFRKVPIIFVSGINVGDFDRLRGYQLGAVDYVTVPIVPEILRSKVATLVQLHQQRLALKLLNTQLEQTNLDLARANAVLWKEREQELLQVNEMLKRATRTCWTPPGARTSSWPCSAMSCATRWPRSPTRWRSSGCIRRVRPTPPWTGRARCSNGRCSS